MMIGLRQAVLYRKIGSNFFLKQHSNFHARVFSPDFFFNFNNIIVAKVEINMEIITKEDLTSDALKIIPTSVMFYYCVWYDF